MTSTGSSSSVSSSPAPDRCTSPQAKRRVAFITGIAGQDGSYLCELLISKGYEVHGMIRRASSFNTGRLEHLYQDRHSTHPSLFLHYGDMTDQSCISTLISTIQPDEVYNLAAQSHVQVSFELSEYTGDVDALGTLRLLEALRTVGKKGARFYQASTSELYGKVQAVPQDEKTPFYPRSPYAAAKLYSYWITINYREAYHMYAVNGVLFNHESPRRGPTFVTRKTTRAVARIHHGLQKCLYLGNLDAKRDWGHAKDYVEAMWMMLNAQAEKKTPEETADAAQDFVVATGETHPVRELVEQAFKFYGYSVEWSGKGIDEVGSIEVKDAKTHKDVIDEKTGKPQRRVVIRVDKKYFRPTEVDLLLGNPKKIQTILGWKAKITFKELVKEMMQAEEDDVMRGWKPTEDRQ